MTACYARYILVNRCLNIVTTEWLRVSASFSPIKDHTPTEREREREKYEKPPSPSPPLQCSATVASLPNQVAEIAATITTKLAKLWQMSNKSSNNKNRMPNETLPKKEF